ncbi:complement component C6 [Aphelenchoides avenae]|nr:complement component C6 [Aphelenchus avenae]
MSAVPPSADPKLAVPNEQSAVPPSANRKSAVPDDTDTEEKTLDEVPQADAIGPDTDQISEYSEDDQGPNATITHSAGIYRRMRPLLRSRQVKGLFVANSVFIIINILLLVAILAFTVPIGITERNYSKEKAKDVPCYYEWTPWSQCTHVNSTEKDKVAKCYKAGDAEPPMKTRRVNPSSVVQARGKYMDTHPCPEGLLDREDKMPCNVHK